MTSSTIPIAITRFRAERNHDIVMLGDTIHDVTCNSHVISDFRASARTHLVLPLTWHHLCVDASNLDACFQAFRKVFISNWTTDGDPSPCSRVVWPLRRWLATIFIETV